MRLSSTDIDLVNRSTLELHSHRTRPALFAALPRIVMRVIAADYCRLLEWRRNAKTRELLDFHHWESAPRIDAAMQRQFARWMPQHPFVIAASPCGTIGPVKLTDFCTVRQFRQSALFREVYRPIDIGPLMGTSQAAGARLRSVSVSRHLGGRDFSEHDRLVLSLLMSHFERAHRNAAATRRPRARQVAGARLTVREAEVAQWLSRGKTNAEIAEIVGIRPRTAEKHVEHILRKLGVENRTTASHLLDAGDDDEA